MKLTGTVLHTLAALLNDGHWFDSLYLEKTFMLRKSIRHSDHRNAHILVMTLYSVSRYIREL